VTGFSLPTGILFDGSSVWIVDDRKLLKLDADGNVIQTVTVVGSSGAVVHPVFDGMNIWVPGSGAATVIRASTGTVVATLMGNGLGDAAKAVFDGDRVLITNSYLPIGVSLWRASDLSPLGFYPTGGANYVGGACSDGLNFWLVLTNAGPVRLLARF
jgi:hypothetical protein